MGVHGEHEQMCIGGHRMELRTCPMLGGQHQIQPFCVLRGQLRGVQLELQCTFLWDRADGPIRARFAHGEVCICSYRSDVLSVTLLDNGIMRPNYGMHPTSRGSPQR